MPTCYCQGIVVYFEIVSRDRTVDSTAEEIFIKGGCGLREGDQMEADVVVPVERVWPDGEMDGTLIKFITQAADRLTEWLTD